MRITNIVGLIGALLATGAFMYGRVTGEMPIPAHVVMYVGLVGALYWIYFNIEQMLVAMRTRSVQQAGVGTLVVALAVGVFLAANYIASRHPERYDATDVGLFTLAPQTIQVLEGLERPVRVIAFYTEIMQEKAEFKDLIEGYQVHTDKLTVQWVDPDFEPRLTEQYGIRVKGTVVLEFADRTEQVTGPTEETLTNALIAVTRTDQKKIYFLEGSGELTTERPGERSIMRAAEELKKKGFSVESLSLLAEGSLPDDARVLVVPGPQKDMLEGEREALNAWLDAGGRMLLLLDPESPEGYLDLATRRGFALPDAVVVDIFGQQLVGDATLPIVVPMGYHPITKDMGEDIAIFRFARPLKRVADASGYNVQMIFGSKAQAWGETDKSAFELTDPTAEEGTEPAILEYDEGADVQGPIDVMGISTWSVGGEEAQEGGDEADIRQGMLAVVGDSDFASDLLFDTKLNGDLFLNTVSFLAQEDDLISIRPRSREGKPYTPTEAEGALVMYSSLLILPGLSFLLGLVFFLRRRNL